MAIIIKEDIPRKLSGRTSLFVSFPYNEKILEIVKSYVPAIWLKKECCWEISSIYLSKLLDDLTYFDDIELALLSPEIEQISDSALTEEELKSFKLEPFRHQIEGINYMLSKKKSLLLDQPGGGKTAQIIYTAETLKRRGLIDHCLIICGVNSLKEMWASEIRKFSNESSVIIGKKVNSKGKVVYDTIKNRAKQLIEPISEFFVILNIESLRDKFVIEAISNSANKFGLIAVDELHRCLLTKTSQQAEGLLKLSSEYKIGATGTILINNPINLYASLAWIGVDRSTLTNFKQLYCNFGSNKFTNYMVTGYKNLELLKDELDSCSIRRLTKDMRDLPPKIVKVELVEMNEEHKKFYEAIKDGIKSEADKIELNSNNLLSLVTRLRQASVDPSLLTSNEIESSKLERCRELVEDLMDINEKVVIMSTFKSPVYKLAELLKDYKPLVCTGDQDDFTVSENVRKFQEEDDAKIFIATSAKCATGLTLNAAAYLICLDTAWTDAMNEQCFNRIYRLNNERPAFITVLQCAETIDQRVWEIAQKKKDMSDFMVDNVNNAFADSLRDDLLSIIKNL